MLVQDCKEALDFIVEYHRNHFEQSDEDNWQAHLKEVFDFESEFENLDDFEYIDAHESNELNS